MANVVPTADINVANGPAISNGTVPISIQNGDRLIINSGIDISSGVGDAVVASFSNLDVEVDGSVSGGFGGFFLNASNTSAAFNYTFDIGSSGVVAGDDGQGIFAGNSSVSGAPAGSLVSVINDGLITSQGFDGVRFQNAATGSLVNSGTINSFDQSTFFASAVTFSNVTVVTVNNSGVIENETLFDGGDTDVGDVAALAFRFAVEEVDLDNSGTIEGPTVAVYSEATVSEDIVNSGTINGDVLLSVTVGGTFENTATGVINGNVRMYGGDDVVVNNGTHVGVFTLGDGDDVYTGTATVDGTVNGGGGNDTIFGSAGNDNIVGRSGEDELRGREGDDFINGDAGNDLVAGGGGNDELRGGGGDDVLSGASGDDTIIGGSDNDTIGGGAGNDTLRGSSGNDELVGGDGEDFLGGGAGQDLLLGRDGDDTLRGSDGNDILVGGTGADILNGGTGADTFEWRFLDESGTTLATSDEVKAFSQGEDLLDISDLSGTAFTFIGTGGFSGSGAAEVQVRVSGDDSIVRLDADGDGTFDMQFIMDRFTGLTADDFIL